MKSIVMDTSNNYLAIAYYDDGNLVDQIKIEALKKQSELALPMLQQILEKAGVTLRQVDEMIISIGPGSYTGVRIALTIAKTLACISPVKVKAISSLKMLVGKKSGIAIIDARGKKYYVGIYDQGKTILEDQLVSEENLALIQEQYKQYPIKSYDEQTPLTKNLYELSLDEEYIEDVDALVPSYIKEVEAKKQCL